MIGPFNYRAPRVTSAPRISYGLHRRDNERSLSALRRFFFLFYFRRQVFFYCVHAWKSDRTIARDSDRYPLCTPRFTFRNHRVSRVYTAQLPRLNSQGRSVCSEGSCTLGISNNAVRYGGPFRSVPTLGLVSSLTYRALNYPRGWFSATT